MDVTLDVYAKIPRLTVCGFTFGKWTGWGMHAGSEVMSASMHPVVPFVHRLLTLPPIFIVRLTSRSISPSNKLELPFCPLQVRRMTKSLYLIIRTLNVPPFTRSYG